MTRYHIEYNKKHYKQLKFDLKEEEYNNFMELSKVLKISKVDLLRLAIEELKRNMNKSGE